MKTMKTGQERRECIPTVTEPDALLDAVTMLGWFRQGNFQNIGSWLNARAHHFAVSRINSNLWPVTQPDIDHAEANRRYLDCGAPGVAGVPRVTHSSGQSFQLTWQPTKGCASVSSVYRFCLSVLYEEGGQTTEHCESYWVFSAQSTGERRNIITLPDELAGWKAVWLSSLRITPRDRVYPEWALSYPVIQYDRIGDGAN